MQNDMQNYNLQKTDQQKGEINQGPFRYHGIRSLSTSRKAIAAIAKEEETRDHLR